MIFLLMMALPLLGALAMLVPADRFLRTDSSVRVFGTAVSGATLLVAVSALTAFDFDAPSSAGMQLEIDRSWAPAIGLRFHLGVDGISLPLVALTALLTFLCFLYTLRHPPAGGRIRLLTALLLVLEIGLVGTFVALDLVLFFVFFEVVLIPMYAVIILWGGPARQAAAYKFILYTLLGSGLLLAGMLLVAVNAGTLDMTELAARHGAGVSHGVQIAAFALMGLGFAVKAPMWPLHTWLPDAHTEAPTVGSVLLAGVLLKMGTYGLVRVALPLAPHGAQVWAPWLGLLAVIGIVYGALACLAQRDLKRMIAYSSVGHMGFVLLGIATLTPVGINAALFGNIAHGLITSLLFFLAGAVKERWGTADLDALGGGLLGTSPRLASILTFASVASLGLPGLAGFWGEMLALLGAYRPHADLPRETFVTFMGVAALGAVLTAAYFLRMLAKLTHGPPSGVSAAPGPAVSTQEYAAWVPLIALTLLVGLWPKTLLDVTTGPVHALFGGG
ncbi:MULTISPECIES: NuoM family protein [Actinomadura]|uniref:NADH-quinone oxidoreductase subunit M n=1 Tax=Actinomadura litoris TaxID=2678616 RepID=A0A7K1LDC4_9ACTN|nr:MULTISPECIES: NADH-quinone oxidoreductase subunit M [Actinomadura]MBT2210308.1 NADH-quinone oxidoreductase subunit M [Actinomadura sp. NEAU-AAG7]MUN42427.1 NADH-quinone oxidoreductase subunit M [Actinomadura litoris]